MSQGQLPADLRRSPLLERVVGLRLNEDASAIASLRQLELGPGERSSFSLCVELVAQVSALVFPHRRLVRLLRCEVSATAELAGRPLVCQAARREGGWLEVKLLQPRDGAEPLRVATASVELADAPQVAPTLAAGDAWMLERRDRALNADSLYAASDARAGLTVGAHRVVNWAAISGLGHLAGALGPRGPHFGSLPSSIPLASSPGVVDGLCQLAQWAWYSLAGEGGQVQAVERIEWYRIPRADEELTAHVSCRGNLNGSPTFDAVAYASDRKPAIELRGLRLMPRALAAESQARPRLEWQSFVRLLNG